MNDGSLYLLRAYYEAGSILSVVYRISSEQSWNELLFYPCLTNEKVKALPVQ